MKTEPRSGSHQLNLRQSPEVLLMAVLSFLPMLWRASLGTARWPNDDSWAYEQIFSTLYRTGHLELIDWNDITLLGMFLPARIWVAVFGNGQIQLHLLGATMGFLSLLGLRSALRSVGSKRRVITLTIFATFSGFIMTTGTFMADLFALAGSMWSLALVLAAVQPARSAAAARRLVVASALCALFAFTVRQQSIVATGVVAIVLFATRNERAPRQWLRYSAIVVVPGFVFYVWRMGLDNGGSTILQINARLVIAGGAVWVVLVGCALAPLALYSGRPLSRRQFGVRVGISLFAGIGAGLFDFSSYVNDYGSYAARVANFGSVARGLSVVIITQALLFVGQSIVRVKWAQQSTVTTALAIGLGVMVLADLASISISSDFYSRYALATLAVALILASTTFEIPAAKSRYNPAGHIALATLILAGYWSFDHTLRTSEAVARVADLAACAGIPAQQLDAGLVWMGWHSDAVAVSRFSELPLIQDGLPPTGHHRIFPGTIRNAVVTESEPVSIGQDEIFGPFRSSGNLPGNNGQIWISVRAEFATAFETCMQAAP